MSFFAVNRRSKPNCPRCGLDDKCNTPRMKFSGEGAKKILIIGGYPSHEDDAAGTQFNSPAGKMLQKELRILGLNVEKDCWKLNATHCVPKLDAKGKIVEPSPEQVNNCRPYTEWVIQELKPEKIILLGGVALASFYGARNTKCTNIMNMAGLRVWDSTYNAWVFPVFDQEVVVSRERDTLLKSEFKRCLARAVKDERAPFKKEWNPLHLLRNFEDAVAALENCLKNDTLIAIDFESTGLTMFKKGHKTVSFSWANDKGSWAVPLEHPYWRRKEQRTLLKLVRNILKKRKIKKIVHNLNLEYSWTKEQLGTEPRGFFWDTLLATHVLDNRTGVISLKFQSYVRWGIEDYDILSKNYIKANSTGFNDMLKMPVDALLKYNALDTMYTYQLYVEQCEELVGRELEAYQFFHEGAIIMCEMSLNGISINKEYYQRQRKILEAEARALISGINASEEATQYVRKYGSIFDYNSPKDLQRMLFNVLNLKPIKETKTGYSVDEEVLVKVDIKLTRDILAVRKLNKMITTYIDGFLEYTYEGMMHPYFSLARARSFRSSSQNPNFQNVPKRDPKAKKITRAGMVPRPGRVLGEMDFSGAEISTSCYYHKDPTFVAYQLDPDKGDMHRDACAEILKITPDEVNKKARQATKGIWTFAQFYGSYFGNCAKQGWEEYPLLEEDDGTPVQVRGMDIGDWIKKTFPTYKSFETHLKTFEKKFWHDWFKGYTQWKDDIAKKYEKTGHVETFLGFKFKGYMNKKQCTNYPIQGTSFHLLIHAAIKFFKRCKQEGLATLIIGQVHDSLILDIPLDEIDIVRDILKEIVETLHETLTWMNFPMGLDFEISAPCEQAGSFASMTKMK